ncbi:MAG: divalent-cation tolerance protein CutA [Leptolyngbya sp. IPPAS B-1204]|nr:divalent-cation tolerance protein CutA [Elainella sp. C42_A2020_010]RNJ69969.1 MAG: divalent-cation tolerance protein CutA [Leptolyngbya sp. IPPAS B-1204]
MEQKAQFAQFGIVFVTAASQAEAETLADALVEAKLAACVSVLPIRSVYTWKGEVCREQEWQLLIKTDLNRFADLEAKIRAIHSYETPEIIAIPLVAGSQPYLDWMAAQVQGA